MEEIPKSDLKILVPEKFESFGVPASVVENAPPIPLESVENNLDKETEQEDIQSKTE